DRALRPARDGRLARPGLRRLRRRQWQPRAGRRLHKALRGVMKFDPLTLPVSNLDRSRDWYVATLGLKVEFEIAASRSVSLQDGEGFAIFLQDNPGAASNGTALWFQVDDVDAIFAEWTARGVAFNHGPQKNFWGYGP